MPQDHRRFDCNLTNTTPSMTLRTNAGVVVAGIALASGWDLRYSLSESQPLLSCHPTIQEGTIPRRPSGSPTFWLPLLVVIFCGIYVWFIPARSTGSFILAVCRLAICALFWCAWQIPRLGSRPPSPERTALLLRHILGVSLAVLVIFWLATGHLINLELWLAGLAFPLNALWRPDRPGSDPSPHRPESPVSES